jgi:hypothetical protein
MPGETLAKCLHQGVANTEFMTEDDAHATIARFRRWWQRVRSSRRN